MNHKQHTSLSLALISYVTRSLTEKNLQDSALASRIDGYVEAAQRHGITVDEKASDEQADGQILRLCSDLIDSHPESVAVLLKQVAYRQVSNWQYRQPLYALYHNLMSNVPTTPVIVDSLMTFMDAEITSTLKVNAANRHEAMDFLLVMAHEAMLKTASVEVCCLKDAFIEVAAQSFFQRDPIGISLISGLYDITKASSQLDEIEDVQKSIDDNLDPLLRLLCTCAPYTSIFGPSLEDFLIEMVKLKEMHQSLLIHAVRPLRGDVVNPQKICELMLSAMTLKHTTLSSEINLPQQSGFYPFGWAQSANFEKHPVVESLNALIPWLDKVMDSNQDLLARAKTNLAACMANWCGHESRSGPEATNRAVSGVILDTVFDKSYLQDVLERVDEKGMQSLTHYVMDNHRALARRLPGTQKGEYLSDSLGL